MFRPRVIPVLLLEQEALVKTKCFENPSYVGDPINTIELFSALGADELVLLDISARKQQREFSPELVEKLSQETAMPLSVGGGIKSISTIELLIRAGAEKIILSTSALQDPAFLNQAVREFGSSTISVCIDVRCINEEYAVFLQNGTKGLDKSLNQCIQESVNCGAGEIILQRIENDGLLCGYDEQLYAQYAPKCPIPIIALGGMNNTTQMKILHENYGVNGFGVGKYFTHLGNSVLISYEKY